MSFQTGLSGLNASSRNLDVIGHNIANANTTGMKASRIEFAELYASSLGAAGGSNSGIGVQVATVSQLFTQGNIKVTGNQLDLAINGSGFFQVKGTDGVTYTRNGEFKLDKDGYIITNNGARLQGYATDEVGKLSNGKETKDLRLPTGAPIDPRATTNINITANLDARAEGLGPLTITNPTTSAQADAMPAEAKQYGTAVNVYDAQGNAIPVQLYFVKNEPVTADPTATPPVVGVPANSWEVYASLDGGRTVIPQSPASTNYSLGRLEFDGSGQLTNVPALNLQITATTPGVTADNTPSEPIAAPISFDVDGKSTITQFGGKFGVYDLTQNGYAKGDLTSIDIGESGVILARYSNGVSKAEGMVALGTFRNLQGLQPVNGGYWSETFASGQAVMGSPQDSGLGLIRQSALEESNVDLTQELVNMIVAQRAYQANAQTIKTQDQVQQTLVNLR